MSFFRSIVLLTSVALAVAFALFVGHGISTGHVMPYILGGVFLAMALGLVFLQTRTGGKRVR